MATLYCFACYIRIDHPICCQRCKGVWFCSHSCLLTDRYHRDYCALLSASDSPLADDPRSSLIVSALMAKALHLQRVLCYNGALNFYQLLLRLRVLLVDPLIQFECHLYSAMCICGECYVPDWTKAGIQRLLKAKSFIDQAKHMVNSACQEDHITLTDDHLLDLIRVEEDITRKLAYLQGNQPFEVEDQEYFSFTRPSRRYYLSKRR